MTCLQSPGCHHQLDNEAGNTQGPDMEILSWPRLILGFIVSKEERNVEIWSGVFKTISAQVFLWVPDDSQQSDNDIPDQ